MDKMFLKKKNTSKEFFVLISLLKNESVQPYNVNFYDLVSLSVEHRVFFILYDDFIKLAEDDSEKLDFLQKIRKKLLYKAFRNLSALIDVIKVLHDNKIEFLIFKGIILSKILYGDFYNRGSIDIDIIVLNEKEIFKIIDILKKRNFFLKNNKVLKNKLFKYFYLKAKNSIQLFSKQYNVSIDLHYRLFGNRIFTANIYKTFVNNKSSFDLFGYKVQTLSAEYHFLFTCVHSSIHCFKRLLWIYDVYMFIKKNNIDFFKVYEIAKQYKLENHFINTMFICHKLFEIDNIEFLEKKIKRVANVTFNKLPGFLNDEDSFNNRFFKFFYKLRLSGSSIESIDIILSLILRVLLKIFSVL